MAAWKLIIEDDAGKTIVVPLARDEITIGRKEGNTIRLTERNVSRQHARLQRENGQVFIHDLESYTGVRINGDRIRGAVEVREGDLIEIGDYHLALQAEGAQQPALAQQQQPADQPTVPAHAASAQLADSPALAESDDQFAGDTQRWDPPADMNAPSVGTPGDDNALADGETARFTVGGDDPTLEAPALGLGTADSNDVTVPGVAPPEPTQAEPPAPVLDMPTAQMPSLVESAEETVPHAPAGETPMPVTEPPGPAVLEPEALEPVPGSQPDAVAGPDDTQAVQVAPGASSSDTARLVVINTVFAGSVLTFEGQEMVLGRTEDNDLIIQHKSVSRNHARVTREGDNFRIHDLGSANGVLVNDEEVPDAVLNDGDVVELGRVRLRYVPPGVEFELAPDEIERARLADQNGDDLDDPQTYVTAPARAKHVPEKSGPPKALFAAAAGLLIVVAILITLFAGGSDKPDEPDGEDPAAVNPAQTKMAEAERLLNGGQYDEAAAAAQDAIDLGGGEAARALLERAKAGSGDSDKLAAADKLLKDGDLKGAYELLSSSDAFPPEQREEAARQADNLRSRLTQLAARDARTAHDNSDTDARAAALLELDKYDEEEAQRLRDEFADEDRVALEEPGDVEEPEDTRPIRSVQARGRRKPKPKPKPDPAPTKRDDQPDPAEVERQVKAQLNLATSLLMQKNAKGAIRILNKAKKLQPGNATIYRQLGLAYDRDGNKARAAANLRKYLRMSPGAPDATAIRNKLSELK